ncbi:hypothetical protein LTR35_017206 [Friedmanniomyces endolithicus]|uniref:Cytochrome P450 n=1 Tax=Friedmanniomyces endolithicus TaxID=329885 RepID=A0AAN6F6C9_9PEZI|nr:hypothetical protein LTR35_017206 [Friedmanniomyces endolithicus]KAK0270931.1 hypothetical protein LTS00_016769 [Friedmanniomyces endolithicus]KAK0304630.1 hypothetical protein LTR82_017137 [Friedmanniomyces endolithicus]KAK0975219.1 hypothetical protein LTR54_016871 [Friedmanniomyces endolithicus]
MVALQVAVLVVAYIAYRAVKSHLANRRFNAFAKQHGCEEPLDLSGTWFDSIGRLRRVFNLKKSGEDILDDIFAEDFQQASTIQRKRFEGSSFLFTVEPANLQAFLATQFDDFETGRLRGLQLGPVLGKSIFTSDGAFWAHSRALFRPQFSRDNINDLEATDKACNALIAAIGPANAEGWTRDVAFQPLCFNFTLDTASEFLFGKSAGSQAAMMALQNPKENPSIAVGSAGESPGSQQFRQDFEIVGEKLISRIRLFSFYWLADGLKFRRAAARLKRFTEHYAQAAILTAAQQTDSSKPASSDGDSSKSKKETLLTRLATQTQDRTELRDQVLAILFAGRDTTASLLGWAFLRLALHPEILSTLRAAILHDFPTSGPDSSEPITFAKLKDCRPLRHFLNEVLRLHPTVPINSRSATRDTTLPTGGGPAGTSPIAIRKGQTVGFSVYIMHRRCDLWGPDALEFNPDRWGDEKRKVPAWQFLPFLGGPRVCVGQQFALVEASYLIVRVLLRYDRLEAVDAGVAGRMRKGLGLTMWPRDGVEIRLREAGGRG